MTLLGILLTINSILVFINAILLFGNISLRRRLSSNAIIDKSWAKAARGTFPTKGAQQ